MSWFRVGCVFAGLSVALGAWAAHGLDQFCMDKYPQSERANVAGQDIPLALKRLNDFRTGVDYQMYHALGLIAAGLLTAPRCRRSLNVAAWFFVIGIVGFSGSLYAITLTGNKAFGIIAPVGGLSFIFGWISLTYAWASPAGSSRDKSGAAATSCE